MYYDEFTQPSISQKPKTPPPKPSTTMKPSAFTQSTAKEPPSAAPLPVTKSSVSGAPAMAKATAETKTLPIRANAANVAEEAAKKAKEMHLQSLRDKVHGTGRKPEPKKEETEEEEVDDESDDEDSDGESDDNNTGSEEASDEKSDDNNEDASEEDDEPQSSSSAPHPGISLHTIKGHDSSSVHSPSSGAWKNRRKSSGASSASEEIRAMVQPSNSSSWKPTDVKRPTTSLAGDVVLPEPSEKQVVAIEKAETMVGEPEPEDEENAKKKAKKSDEKKSSRGKEKPSTRKGTKKARENKEKKRKEKKENREKKEEKENREKKEEKEKDKYKKEKDKSKVKNT